MNRVTAHIAQMQQRIDGLDDAGRAKLDADMDVEMGEHFAYQEAQAQAHASGKLSTEEAMVVYRALGEVGSSENGGWAKGTDLATKVTVTLLMGELVRARMGIRA